MKRVVRAAAFAIGLTAIGAAALFTAPPAAQATSATRLELVAVRHSLMGTHSWYRQVVDGHPVLGSYYAVHAGTRTGERSIDDGRVQLARLPRPKALLSRSAAVAAVRVPGTVRGAELVVRTVGPPRLVWSVVTESARGSTRTLVDAGSGAVLDVLSLVKHVQGTGRVFSPNPVVTLQREGLKDTTAAADFLPAYRTVTLTRLDRGGKLRGAYAYNANPAENQAMSKTYAFVYNRAQAGFEQVTAYYAITTAQEHIHALGFKRLNSEPQDFVTAGLTDDNSFYDPESDRITYGTGGVDDAEDVEVVWHEYGHAIQDAQVPGFGSSAEAAAIGEGFGDYWAYSMSSVDSADTAKTPLACIADWDAVSYTTTTPHCLRRTDGNKVYPKDVVGEVHADGEIWSRALMDINKSLGRTRADRIILEAQFTFAPDTTFAAAAHKTIAAAKWLYGRHAVDGVRAAFHARGIL